MKPHILLTLGSIFLWGDLSQSHAQGTSNPTPTTLQLPTDPIDQVVKRLTASSNGQTPTVKNLDPEWIKTLGTRGEPTVYTKANSHNFDYIGMPVGGIGAGEVYLSGDGKLWDWDIFNTRVVANFPVNQGGAYQFPLIQGAPKDGSQNVLTQGFAIRTTAGGKTETRTLDRKGFADIKFQGQYPIGYVDYADPASPVQVKLEAFSPFVPSSVEDSTYPSTILNYTVTNSSSAPVECTLGGWMENAAGWYSQSFTEVLQENHVVKSAGALILNCSLAIPATAKDNRAPVVFDDFEELNYAHWTVEGEAFGKQPVQLGDMIRGLRVAGYQGRAYIDSLFNRKDTATGTLTSQPFKIERPFLTFLIGGGKKPGTECLNLLVDGKVVRTATGEDTESLRPSSWDVKEFNGKMVQLQIVDAISGPWGHTLVDNICQSDAPDKVGPLTEQCDYGTMALALVGDPATAVGSAQVNSATPSSLDFDVTAPASAQKPTSKLDAKLVGALARNITLKPGEKKTVSFVISWYFPNSTALNLKTPCKRQYSERFKSAQDVAEKLTANFDHLSKTTRLWHDQWYNSSLPYWFLDRTFLNTSILATSTSYLVENGRFYGYEGRYSCPGTCTHVWGYQQALGFLFPELEKGMMEKVQFVPGLGMNEKGGIAMRGEYDPKPPVDGQAGIILRTYLSHRMSPDNAFLTRNYAAVKKATDYLVDNFDANNDGIMEGGQANTMDAEWYGKITWLSLHYQAALRATAQMADVMKDAEYAKKLRGIADSGRKFIEEKLFNGEYFFHEADPAVAKSPGTFNGSFIEQLMGQSWAYQVGLGQIIDPAKAITALDSLWKYNFTTDVGVYRKQFPKGRNYALPGEGGIIMCTFPKGGEDTLKVGNQGFAAYNNECWPGSEYEVTGLMMWQGLVDKALAEVRTINERHDGSKRNPWNETECGSHYSRSLASYGVFTAACGFQYDGPNGMIGFTPRISPENFKAAFTAAEGWGSFSQESTAKSFKALIDLAYGKLRLKTVVLTLPAGNKNRIPSLSVGGKPVGATHSIEDNLLTINLKSDLDLEAGQSLKIAVN